MRYAKKRDECESRIIAALLAVGCSVQQLNEKGAPDLLVGKAGVTLLIECKDSHGSYKKHGKKSQSGLRESQEKWWLAWKGAPPFICTKPEEAIAAVYAAIGGPERD